MLVNCGHSYSVKKLLIPVTDMYTGVLLDLLHCCYIIHRVVHTVCSLSRLLQIMVKQFM